MPRSKRTIARDSVFRPSGEPPVPQGVSEPAAPTRQTGVWLTDEEIEWLDTWCREVRRGGWRGITRSAFIRALIQAMRSRSPDLAGVSGEAELVEALKQAIEPAPSAPSSQK
jgi:hypothetical protein